MRWFYKSPLRFRSLVKRTRVEQELADELSFHTAQLIEEKIGQAMTPEEARYAALRELGGLEQIKEECRDMRRVNYIENFIQDVHYGLRMLAKSPGFTAVAVVTLALGIGANTAIFSLVDTILLRPLPYRNPEQLVLVSETLPQMGGDTEVGMAAGEYLDYRDRNRSFVQTAAYEAAGFNLTGEGSPLRVNAAAVTASAFPLLGVRPRLGRTFTADEERLGSTPVAVLSYSLWQNQYGADRGIVGRPSSWTKSPT
jgi:putative ABC transport system permease protein